jgi:hypothetical protein
MVTSFQKIAINLASLIPCETSNAHPMETRLTQLLMSAKPAATKIVDSRQQKLFHF